MITDNLKDILPVGTNPKLMRLLQDLISATRENRIQRSPNHRITRGPNGTSIETQGTGKGGASTTIAVWG